MEDQKNLSIIGAVRNLFQTSFKLVSDTFSLAKAEAHLASQSFVQIIILAFVLGTLFTTTWLVLLALLTVFLLSLNLSWLAALGIVLLCNLFIITCIVLVILKLRQNLSFKATRRHLFSRQS